MVSVGKLFIPEKAHFASRLCFWPASSSHAGNIRCLLCSQIYSFSSLCCSTLCIHSRCYFCSSVKTQERILCCLHSPLVEIFSLWVSYTLGVFVSPSSCVGSQSMSRLLHQFSSSLATVGDCPSAKRSSSTIQSFFDTALNEA